jgi:RNA polymerase sigma-70 factor (ECF subfamily)
MIINIGSDFAVQPVQESDDQLLSKARSGDQRAFAELCLRCRGMLLHRIYRIVQHREDAEDVLQETLLSAYQHLDSFRGVCRFSTWMTKIGINQSLMFLRKRKRSPGATLDITTDDGQSLETSEFRDPGPNPEQHYLMCRTLQGLRRAIDRLPPRLRGMMDLYYRKDLLLRNAAEALGITEEAAKSRLMRARNLLRLSIKDQWNAPRESSKHVGTRSNRARERGSREGSIDVRT